MSDRTESARDGGAVTERLKVLQVVTLVSIEGRFGGPVSVAESQARELAGRGHRVVVTGLRDAAAPPPDGLTADQWRLFAARTFVPGAGMLGLLSLPFLRYLWRTVGESDVVHVHSGRDLVSMAALLVARLRRVPVVAQTHGMVLPRRHLRARLFDPLFLGLLRRAAVVMWMTEQEQADLRAMLGTRATLRFLGNGVALSAQTQESPDPPHVVFLARIHPVKRPVAFVEMAHALGARGVVADYSVYGPDQGALPDVRRRIRELGLQDQVTYRGAVDHDTAGRVLASASVYVLPSSADWMPMSLIEALAAGVPSICTTACGIAAVLDARAAAVVVDGSVASLTDAVESVLSDPTLAERLSANARQVVHDNFSAVAMVDELERIYTSAVAAVGR